MKIVKKLTPEEAKAAIPAGLFDALNAIFNQNDMETVTYCNRCDGIRLLEHDCHCWRCGSPTCHILECLRGTPRFEDSALIKEITHDKKEPTTD